MSLRVLGVLLGVAALVACSSEGRSSGGAESGSGGVEASPAAAGTSAREAGLDVLLITIDTLRADALGSYGNRRAETPWMDRLAARGVRFTDAHAHNVLTLPSHANILSGLYPQEHGVRDNAGFRFPADVTTLATVLRDAGYRTGAFLSAFPLDSRFGLGRGFDVYEDSFADTGNRPAFLEQERAGDETVALAREWLAAVDDRPSFAWVHLYEPHFPYAPPEPFATRFRDRPYDGDVAAADAALTPLLDPILTAGEASDTLVVLTSDHGESLGEHGEATHGIFAYESVLRVPLILFHPRLFAPRVADAPVGHVDLMPTILDALDLPVPSGLSGRSLLSAASGRAVVDQRPIYFEALSGQLNRGWAPLYGVIRDRRKYIDLPIAELYDLERDPREERNLAASDPARVTELAEVLQPLLERDRGAAASPESAEVRERLAALGYLSGARSSAKQSWGVEDDPKRLIELDHALRQIAGLHAAGDLAGALERCRELVRRRPGMPLVLRSLAQLERESGDLGAATKALEKALALHPGDMATLALLGATLTQAGRADEAARLTEQHTGGPAPDPDVLFVRAQALARLGRAEEARQLLARASEIDPSNAMVPVHLGTLFLMQGQRAEAKAAYRRALELNSRVVPAHTALAILASEEGRAEEAVGHWRSAVEVDERQVARLLAVGQGLWRAGKRSQARPLLELFAETAPPAAWAGEIDRVRRVLTSEGTP